MFKIIAFFIITLIARLYVRVVVLHPCGAHIHRSISKYTINENFQDYAMNCLLFPCISVNPRFLVGYTVLDAQSLLFCEVFCQPLFIFLLPFTFSHCIVCFFLYSRFLVTPSASSNFSYLFCLKTKL